jgi:DnaJ-class molecular chaperone
MKVLVDHECAACKGYGQVFIYPRDKKDDSSNRLLVTCRACSGRGYNTIREPHKMTCPNCDGRGFNLKKHWKTCQRCFGQKDPAPHNQIAPEMAK